MKVSSRWYSRRLQREVSIARWGTFGTPVLVFPTAGGDAEEIERMHLVDAVGDLIDAGRVKIYSVDSVAGAAMLSGEGSEAFRARLLNFFHQFVREEAVPAIYADCGDQPLDIVTAGSSIGAFNAAALICRYPDVFSRAICMSGTYNMRRFIEATSDDLYYASPLEFLPSLDGDVLDRLRQRFVLLASGQGAYEDIRESWRLAHVLGQKGVPNRVDPWGPEWDHEWPTWRRMLPQYLDEVC